MLFKSPVINFGDILPRTEQTRGGKAPIYQGHQSDTQAVGD